MASRRDPLLPGEATSEGQRRLRVLLRRLTFGAIARVLRCDESTVRGWAKRPTRPHLTMRAAMERAPQIGIPEWTWDEPPVVDPDPYAGGEPRTTRR